MGIVGENIALILLVSGAVTATMIVQLFAPERAVSLVYGAAPRDPAALLMARYWGALIFLVGVLLMVSAVVPELRLAATCIAGAEKLVFATLVFTGPIGSTPLTTMALGDCWFAALYAAYLLGF